MVQATPVVSVPQVHVQVVNAPPANANPQGKSTWIPPRFFHTPVSFPAWLLTQNPQSFIASARLPTAW